MLEDGFVLLLGDFLEGVDDLVHDTLTDLPAAVDVKHGGIGVTLDVIRAVDVGVVDRGLGVDPADQIARALVACGSAETEDLQVFAVLLAQEDTDLAPVVGGDEGAMLNDLCRAGNACRNTREFSVRTIEEEHLDAAVVAAFQFGKCGGVGVAPHLGAAVGVAHAAAHTDRRSAKSGGVAAGGAVLPRFDDRCGDAVYQEEQRFARRHNIFRVIGNLCHILLFARQEAIQDALRAACECGIVRRLIVVHVRGVGMDRAEDDLVRGDGGVQLCDLFAHAADEVSADLHEVAGAEDHLLRAVFDGKRGGNDRRLDILGDALKKLSGKADPFILRRNVDFRPADFEFTHDTYLSS